MTGRRIVVRKSAIHGRGVFATTWIRQGEFIVDYAGDVITADEAARRFDFSADGHTFLFDIGDGLVIDGGCHGNSSRWINHSCEPNVVAETAARRVRILAARDIGPGEELLLDYQLSLGDGYDGDEDERASYACACGSRSCRQTMLSA